jgi:hypothetical protein
MELLPKSLHAAANPLFSLMHHMLMKPWNPYGNSTHADEAMEPLWQQHGHPHTFDVSQLCPDAAHMNRDS